MVETTTKNYGWVKPEVQHSPTTWGGFLNNDLDAIDALVFANQMGITPIGGIMPYAGDTAPPNWLMCDGLVYQNANIPLLAPILKNRFNAGTSAVAGTSSAVPNLTQRFPLGIGRDATSIGATGGTFSYTISVANLPAHNHPASQAAHTHGATQVAHNHGVSQPAHTHPDPGHTHSASEAAHSHTVNAQVLTPINGVNVAAGSGWVFGAANSVGTSAAQPTITVGAAVTGLGAAQPAITVFNAQPAITVDTQTPAVTVGNTGSGTALNVVPQYVGLSFIIRYQ
jgi:microcystin-dependent protein